MLRNPKQCRYPLNIAARRTIYSLAGACAVGLALWTIHMTELWFDSPQGTPASKGGSSAVANGAVHSAIVTLESRPEDVDTLLQLGQAYAVVGRTSDAEAALAKAHQKAPNNPTVVAELAWSSYRNNGTTSSNAQVLYEKLHRLKPEHPEALAYLALGAFQRGDYASAIALWETLLGTLPADSALARDVNTALTKTRSLTATTTPSG